MTPGRAVLVELIRRYLAGLLDPAITLLEVHKLMYFMQEAGEQLRLRFREAPYGPYAENLRHVLKAVEGRSGRESSLLERAQAAVHPAPDRHRGERPGP